MFYFARVHLVSSIYKCLKLWSIHLQYTSIFLGSVKYFILAYFSTTGRNSYRGASS